MVEVPEIAGATQYVENVEGCSTLARCFVPFIEARYVCEETLVTNLHALMCQNLQHYGRRCSTPISAQVSVNQAITSGW